MSRRSSKRVSKSASAPSCSQASTSTQRERSLTQTTIDEALFQAKPTNTPELINNCVRFMVYNAGHNAYFPRNDVAKVLGTKTGVLFQEIINAATRILKNVYGYNVIVCDPAARHGKAFLVSNALPYVDYNLDEEDSHDKNTKKVLLLLILSHIYMSGMAVLENSLHSFLKNLNIDVNVRHPVFGKVKDYISVLVKKKFLIVETDAVSKKVSFSWGMRAEKEISKLDILKFVCKVYGETRMENFADQLRVANEQGFENDKNMEQ